jgi:hypothetical protein
VEGNEGVNRGERVAKNEILFRQVNERILEIEGDRWRVDPVDFMCECGNMSCTRVLQMSVVDYERLRSDPARFGVIPGHELPDVETVVEKHPHYVVVEKAGEFRQHAIDADPRADG